MKVNVGFAVCVDVIEFEEFMGKDVNKYKESFENWYFEVVEKFGTLVRQQRSTLKYKYFNSQPIVDWMNEVSPGCNARVIAKDIMPGQEDTSLPYMYF